MNILDRATSKWTSRLTISAILPACLVWPLAWQKFSNIANAHYSHNSGTIILEGIILYIGAATVLFVLLTTVAMYRKEPSVGWSRLSVVIAGLASIAGLISVLVSEGISDDSAAYGAIALVTIFPGAMFFLLWGRQIERWVRDGFANSTSHSPAPLSKEAHEDDRRATSLRTMTKWVLYVASFALLLLVGVLTLDYEVFIATVTQVIFTVAVIYPIYRFVSRRQQRKKENELQALADELARDRRAKQ